MQLLLASLLACTAAALNGGLRWPLGPAHGGEDSRAGPAVGAGPTAAPDTLAWFAASDTHLGHDPVPQNGSAVMTSYAKNAACIAEMMRLPTSGEQWPASLGGGAVSAPALLTISGDLIDDGDGSGTAVNGCHQWANFTALFGLDGTDGLLRGVRVYEGRGNHVSTRTLPVWSANSECTFHAQDGDNSTSPLPNDCASVPARAVVARNKLRQADPAFGIDAVSTPTGLHYSWTARVSDACRVHFVHLNLFPGHQCGSAANPGREGKAPGGFPCQDGWTWPEDSLGFLETDLAANAVAPGTLVVTIMHYGLDGWSQTWVRKRALMIQWSLAHHAPFAPQFNADQTAEMFAVLHKYNTLAAFVGHTHSADLYSHNGTAQGEFNDPRPGFITVVNAPATQKEDGQRNPLPSEFLAVEVSVNATTGAGVFRVAQRVGQAWGKVLGSRPFVCA
jgi:hypothetical protein